ncbi:hypothetical protein DENSPDRAFT_839372 [Dentipellis sp. KUC8613]|nr:hypothetical protein DENSPDRAFT_839372 [Dentipellis sp. KUC8613]
MTSLVGVLAREAKKATTNAARNASRNAKILFVSHSSRQCYDAHQQRIPCPTSKTGRIIAAVVAAIAVLALTIWLCIRFRRRRTERGVADSEAPVDAAEREEAAQPLTLSAEHRGQVGGSEYPLQLYPPQSTDTLPAYNDKITEVDYTHPAYDPKMPMPSYHGPS